MAIPGAIGQLIIIGPKAIKDEERIKRHPVEMGDPDYGEVQEARSASVDKRFVMVQAMVDCNSVVERTSGPGPLQNYHYEITREYRFIYGVGLPDQKVIRFKHKKTVWKDGRLYSDFHETDYVDQSPDYTDP
jgi:hypothetical protein